MWLRLICILSNGCDQSATLFIYYNPHLFMCVYAHLLMYKGIHAGMRASHFLPSIIGRSAATRVLLTADELTGNDGYRIGLISDLAADQSNVKGDAYDIAAKISRRGTVAVRSMTQTLRASQEDSLEVALLREAHSQAMCYARIEDWNEGLDSIIERRDPVYSNYYCKDASE